MDTIARDWKERAEKLEAEVADLRARLGAMPAVECGCHPGVRWTTETWGQECPISKAERERDDLRAKLGHIEAVVARRPALDDEPTLYAKIEKAIRVACESDGLRAEVAKLEDKLENWVVCYHCYETMPAPGADDHGRVCPKHPQRKVEAERDALAAQVAALRESLHAVSCSVCAKVFADTAQAATEYRERIVRGVVAQTVDTMLAAASEQWDAARSRGVNPVDAFGEVMDRLRADHAGGSR